MRAVSTASERLTVTALGGLLLVACAAGCECGARHPVGDAPPVRDGAPASDATADADAAPEAAIDASVALCPPWRPAPAVGRAWLYTRALGSNGVSLTSGNNHVDIYVRRAGDARPGERASANDPCAVASYDRTAPHVQILAAAIGFSSQEREFDPAQCGEATPCALELPPSLEARYYIATADRVVLKPVTELSEAERRTFAADVGKDALARSKALNRPLADELDRAEKATSVPAQDIAIHYTELKLQKRCDVRCIDDPSLDPAMRKYFKNVRPRPGRPNPFELRSPITRRATQPP